MHYALVDNNIIQVGPREYHTGFFNNYLKSKDIDFNLPPMEPFNNPIIINDEIKILPVINVVIPNYHPVTEQLSGPYYTINENEIVGEYTIADVELTSAKNKMKEIVASLRYDKENTIIKVTIQNQEVSIGTHRGLSRDFYIQTYLLMNDTDTKLIKFPIENIWINCTKSDLYTIVSTINNTVQTSFDWENQQIMLIESADKQTLATQYLDIIPKPIIPILQSENSGSSETPNENVDNSNL